MTRLLDGALDFSLIRRSQAGDAIRQNLSPIVDETLEDTDIAIINIADAAYFERVVFLFRQVALRALLPVLTGLTGPLCAGLLG